MTARPTILLTNDDGISAPGIRHLWEATKDLADIVIVAPHAEKSGSGLSITWTKPLHVRPYSWGDNVSAWSLNGTPADCVKMALAVVLDKRPDMIISGINRGSNAGRTVLYSGTIGGCIEGVFKKIPGIGFSFSDFDPPPIETTRKYIRGIIQHFLANPLPEGTLLNVNFPFNTKEKVLGARLTKQGKSYWREDPDRRVHPEGAPYYWLGGAWSGVDEDPSSDVALLEKGYITMTPIQVGELTCHSSLEQFKDLSDAHFNMESDLLDSDLS